ncbi:receptor-transporting protein 3-like [Hoplias malabaricus]|uniref:receptor-transporting protein 3-like n=1 Tax=Hoplias malabaricus TaxID=27720 RepID=UPI00346265FB
MEQWDEVFQSRFSGLVEDQWTLVLDDSIEPSRTRPGWFQYIRTSFAQFRCSLCRRSWPSKRVQVLFHFYLDSSLHRGTVKLRRFRQKCRRCTAAKMEEPRFSPENVDIMLEKLLEKVRIRFYGENPPESNRPFRFNGRVEGPHETQHCEACQRGYCSQNTQ